ncbi:hypothetical protein [Gleimia hominis]|uniref:hypothetical protein n=1 Tax=Gleimia hominis TaxID=595468 RepID=UPI000C802176|nr:hypothetical protein [Gleimia hominis]WIK64863.1 hypothetical protein CJ187_002035 [Gleimia hominis]
MGYYVYALMDPNRTASSPNGECFYTGVFELGTTCEDLIAAATQSSDEVRTRVKTLDSQGLRPEVHRVYYKLDRVPQEKEAADSIRIEFQNALLSGTVSDHFELTRLIPTRNVKCVSIPGNINAYVVSLGPARRCKEVENAVEVPADVQVSNLASGWWPFDRTTTAVIQETLEQRTPVYLITIASTAEDGANLVVRVFDVCSLEWGLSPMGTGRARFRDLRAGTSDELRRLRTQLENAQLCVDGRAMSANKFTLPRVLKAHGLTAFRATFGPAFKELENL